MARKITNQLLKMVKEGSLNKDTLILACLIYMSEYEVQDMAERNNFIVYKKDEEDDCND